MSYRVKDIETGEVFTWSLARSCMRLTGIGLKIGLITMFPIGVKVGSIGLKEMDIWS